MMQSLRSLNLFILGMLLFVCGSVHADDNPIEQYYEQAHVYIENGQVDKAIESFRKVLYINSYHAKANFELAQIYDKEGNLKRAKREYQFFLSALPKDETYSQAEKRQKEFFAEERIDAITALLRKKSGVRYESDVPFLFSLILVLLVGLIIMVGLKVLSGAFGKVRDRKRLSVASKIWTDPYWERQQDQNIRYRRVGPVQFFAGAYVVGFLIYACIVIQSHGITAVLKAMLDLLVFWA